MLMKYIFMRLIKFLKDAGNPSLGTLMIDESGQAIPQLSNQEGIKGEKKAMETILKKIRQ